MKSATYINPSKPCPACGHCLYYVKSGKCIQCIAEARGKSQRKKPVPKPPVVIVRLGGTQEEREQRAMAGVDYSAW
jgi:hypothetical protein